MQDKKHGTHRILCSFSRNIKKPLRNKSGATVLQRCCAVQNRSTSSHLFSSRHHRDLPHTVDSKSLYVRQGD